MARTRRVAAALALAAASLVPRSARAIRGGTVDTGDPAVVALSGCTATLISPRVVLTAAHCVYLKTPDEITVSFGPTAAGATRKLHGIDIHIHPAYAPATEDDDLALVMLDQEVTDVAPVLLNDSILGDDFVGTSLRIVGYGVPAADATPDELGTKRSGQTTVTAFLAGTFVDANQPAGACGGDSGGPALMSVGGTEAIVGVMSRGDEACTTFGVKTRIDPFVDDFIMPYVVKTSDGGSDVGDPCAVAEQCASGTCLAALDDPRSRACSQSCKADPDCPASMACGADGMCRWPVPSPGVFGASCDSGVDCFGALCASGERGGPHICTVDCVPGADSPCASGYVCVTREGGFDGESVCMPEPTTDGGCAVAPPSSSPWSICWVGMVFLAGLIRRTCRRCSARRRRSRCCRSRSCR